MGLTPPIPTPQKCKALDSHDETNGLPIATNMVTRLFSSCRVKKWSLLLEFIGILGIQCKSLILDYIYTLFFQRYIYKNRCISYIYIYIFYFLGTPGFFAQFFVLFCQSSNFQGFFWSPHSRRLGLGKDKDDKR